MGILTEIVTFQIVENIGKEQFIGIVDNLENNFHSKQSGFIDTELLYNDKDNEWTMIQHWESKEDLQSSAKKMFNNPVTEEFVKSLNPSSMKMLKLPQLKCWKI